MIMNWTFLQIFEGALHGWEEQTCDAWRRELYLVHELHVSGETKSFLKDSYRATIGGRPILPLFTRGSVYVKTLIAW